MTVFGELTDLIDQGEPAAMLTVVGKEGSAPRDVGTRMLVTADEEYGTIGGGTVEGLAIEAARAVLAGDAGPGVRTYELEKGGNTGMVCGGQVDVFVDRIGGRSRLLIGGGGHIGAELAALAVELGESVTVVDDREEYADADRFPGGVEVLHDDYGDALRDLPMGPETAVVSATRSNTFDQDVIAAALDGGAGYVGAVASDTKAEHITDSLVEDGYSRRELADVRTPVGLELGGGSPSDIALAILAERSADRHGTSGERASQLALDDLAVVRGGGDLGSGVAYRLHQAGYPVVVTDVAEPTVVRRAVAFGTAMYEGEITVEGAVGRRANGIDEAVEILADGDIPVIADPEATIAEELGAAVLVDAIMAKGKRDTGTRRDDAETVVGLGPGFEAMADADRGKVIDGDAIPVDAVVETDRGHQLGRVFYEGTASDYDGIPGEREGFTTERVLRAPADGTWETAVDIGETVSADGVVGYIDSSPVETQIGGLVRGLIHDDLTVSEGTKLGDVDPRGEAVDYEKISDKALCLGGGVLEAVLRLE
ncbi:selenium-dependent molybdenum cofactor biosynthesis protein YqeB [Salinibaculum salinum]|uniref:selenium-dependent molybdenum cofactor biosynthesis protein YqeB n=1 Tax=Salinibaculum salinum TaxID=3131996 RepID=UPI0030EE51E0